MYLFYLVKCCLYEKHACEKHAKFRRHPKICKKQQLVIRQTCLARVTLYAALYYTNVVYKYMAKFASLRNIQTGERDTYIYIYIQLYVWRNLPASVWEAGATGNNGGK